MYYEPHVFIGFYLYSIDLHQRDCTVSIDSVPSPASISSAAAAAAAAAALSLVDGSRHSLTEPPCPPVPLIYLYTPYADLESREGRGEGVNQERSLPRVITPTHEFVAVSFVEFVFLLP